MSVESSTSKIGTQAEPLTFACQREVYHMNSILKTETKDMKPCIQNEKIKIEWNAQSWQLQYLPYYAHLMGARQGDISLIDESHNRLLLE